MTQPPPESPTYDDAEVEEILRRALERSGGAAEGLTHAELAEVAAEVGLSADELEHAARSVLAARAQKRERDEAKLVLDARKRHRRRGFAQHILTWGVVGTGLAALDYLTGGGIGWALYPIVGWGIGVGLHGVGLAFRDDEKEIHAIARKLRRQRERAAKEAERQRGKPKRLSAEVALEVALEKGIALLLTKVAEKLDAAASPPPKPRDTDFNRFIAQKKGAPVRVEPAERAGREAPRTRVEREREEQTVDAPTSTRKRERER